MSEMFERNLSEALREVLLKAAEPAIEAALKEVERTLRGRVAEAVTGLMRRDYSVAYQRDEVLIRVNLGSLTGEPVARP